MKNISYRYDINRVRSRHGHKYRKYKIFLSMKMLICVRQHLRTFKVQFMKTLISTGVDLKKPMLIKKCFYCISCNFTCKAGLEAYLYTTMKGIGFDRAFYFLSN